jgi:hypothetical protein
VLRDLASVVLKGGVGDRADCAGVLLSQDRVGRRKVSVDGTDDRAGRVGDGVALVRVLESGAG